MFSCGSSRKAPLTPARGISFDSIVYFDASGLNGTETPLSNVAARSSFAHDELHSEILVELEHLKERDVELENSLTRQREMRELLSRKASQQYQRGEPLQQHQGLAVKGAFAVGAVFASALLVLFIFKTRQSRL